MKTEMPTLNETAGDKGGRTPARAILEVVSILIDHRKFLLGFVSGVTLLSVVISLLFPKWYKSTASVFPAEKTELFSGLEGVASLAKSFSPGRALSSLSGNSETDRYLAILKSARVLGAVIQKFDLVKVYDITSYPGEKTVKELLSNVDFTVESEGNLTVTVYDKDPKRAADMANYFVEMLNETNTELQGQNAKANRGFIEQRYEKNIADLAEAEDSLKVFQKKYGIIALPEQTEATIKAAAEITAQMALRDVQLGVLRRTSTSSHPGVKAAEVEIAELRKKLSEMNTGSLMQKDEMSVFVPFKNIPDLGGEYVRRVRDVEIQYKILQFITPIYEQAKVEEKRQTPSVLVLDVAFPAERKAKPKVLLIGLLGMLFSTVLALAFVFVIEMTKRLRSEDPTQFQSIVSAIRSDIRSLRKIFNKE